MGRDGFWFNERPASVCHADGDVRGDDILYHLDFSRRAATPLYGVDQLAPNR